jgi:hypothetical protein
LVAIKVVVDRFEERCGCDKQGIVVVAPLAQRRDAAVEQHTSLIGLPLFAFSIGLI